MSNIFSGAAPRTPRPSICKSKKKRDQALCPISWPDRMIMRFSYRVQALPFPMVEIDYTITLNLISGTTWSSVLVPLPPMPGWGPGLFAGGSFFVQPGSCLFTSGSVVKENSPGIFAVGVAKNGLYDGGEPFVLDSGVIGVAGIWSGFGQYQIRAG